MHYKSKDGIKIYKKLGIRRCVEMKFEIESSLKEWLQFFHGTHHQQWEVLLVEQYVP